MQLKMNDDSATTRPMGRKDRDTTPLHQGQLRAVVGYSPTIGGFPTTIWISNR